MSELKLDPDLLTSLRTMRGELADLFNSIREADSGASEDNIAGKQRLERVPAFQKRHFNQLLSLDKRFALKRAATLLAFLSDADPLKAKARAGLYVTLIDQQLNSLRESEIWMSAKEQLRAALADVQVSRPSALVTGGSHRTQFVDQRISGDTADGPVGKAFMSTAELLFAQAEWRATNMAPGEGQWLQLFLRIQESYTRDRSRGLDLDVHLHRVHINIYLDGGRANPREELSERSDVNGNKIVVREGNAWTDARPQFDIDNPKRSTPLTGRYDWFDLCEVAEKVGEDAVLEISATKCGLAIALPEDVRDQLDPDRLNDYDVPEERLIEAWLRNRAVPKSDLAEGGRYRLVTLPIGKGVI